MKKFLILFCLFLAASLKAEITEVFLTNIPFRLEIDGINNEDSLKISVLDENGDTVSVAEAREGLVIKNSGVYSIFYGKQKVKTVRIIPAWFSVLPPLLAILIALVFRQVLLALFSGILLGAFFMYDFNLITAFFRIGDTLLPGILLDKDHILIILFTLIIGGVVGIISANGGTKGLAEVIVSKAKTARSGMLASWLMGLAIFFDDYSNSLLVGNMMRPITDKLKISREKLAYIVDSTAAPVTSLVVVSTWIGYELGLIGDALEKIGSPLSAYDVFIQSIAYRFYPIAALTFVLMIAWTKRDFGPMLKAERRAKKREVIAGSSADADDISELEKSGIKSSWYNAVIPIAVLLLGTFAGLVLTGKSSLENAGVFDYGFKEIIGSANSYYALLWGSMSATAVAITLTAFQRIISLEKILDAFLKGMRSLFVAVVILTLAWAIGKITAEVKTADYLISALVGSVDIRFLASLVFIVCALTSFATGTSWGTMAIIMPIVIPLTVKLGSAAQLSALETNAYLVSTVAAVLAGSVFGDHCSPIADTTILSSLASGCNHIAHVRTQLPYALLVGTVSLLFGSFATAFGFPVTISYTLIFISLYAALIFIGRKSE